jgi:hypothetical protein
LFLEIVAICSAASFLLISAESAIVLFVFDFLFVTLAFQLTRKLSVKLRLLALGNIVGLFFNLFFSLLTFAGFEYFGEVFRVFYAMVFPVFNVSWMVIFWSLSLATFSKPTYLKSGD